MSYGTEKKISTYITGCTGSRLSNNESWLICTVRPFMLIGLPICKMLDSSGCAPCPLAAVAILEWKFVKALCPKLLVKPLMLKLLPYWLTENALFVFVLVLMMPPKFCLVSVVLTPISIGAVTILFVLVAVTALMLGYRVKFGTETGTGTGTGTAVGSKPIPIVARTDSVVIGLLRLRLPSRLFVLLLLLLEILPLLLRLLLLLLLLCRRWWFRILWPLPPLSRGTSSE